MNDLYESYLKALDYPGVPTLFLDQDSLDQNIKWVISNAHDKKIRIATKSIRCREVVKNILESSSVFQGIMTYDLREALWLRDQGFKDILMGYPSMDKEALAELAKNPEEIVLMVDLPEHLEYLENIARPLKVKFKICVDVDMSMDLPGLRFGVFRSQINSSEKMKVFLKKLKSCQHLKLTGLMGYEAQIAGVMDKESFLIRALKKLSLRQLQERRKELVSLIHADGHILEFVNGGGTGSLQDTVEESCVTEITVGSGFFAPVLFDHYKAFRLKPALAFTLPIVRNPVQEVYTCLGGGYIASGSVEKIKQPEPYLPLGAVLLKHEGAGEVQTPVHYNGKIKLKIGDSIIMRHAKAGEVCERFSEIQVINHGKKLRTIKTYRGEGKNFV